jgi:hypothetical protein
MQYLVFDNRKYVKAKDAAKKFRYTADYMGQLCRSGKVEARTVGRQWYVYVDSITAYQKTKHALQKQQAKTLHTRVSKNTDEVHRTTDVPRKVVKPVLRTKTLRVLTDARKSVSTSTPSSYHSDQSQNNISIIRVNDTDESHTAHIHRPSKQDVVATPVKKVINIQSNANPAITLFKSEKVKEIRLSGSVAVERIASHVNQSNATENFKIVTKADISETEAVSGSVGESNVMPDMVVGKDVRQDVDKTARSLPYTVVAVGQASPKIKQVTSHSYWLTKSVVVPFSIFFVSLAISYFILFYERMIVV